MRLGDDKILFAGNDFHLKVSVLGIDDVELVDDRGDALVGCFGEDDGADVVFVGKDGRTEVHVSYVAYDCESAWDLVEVGRKGC